MNAYIQTMRNLGPLRLGIIGAVAVILLGVLIYLSVRVSGTEMALLYGDLSTTDASRIDQRLTQLNVPHQLRNDNTQILVPVDAVAKSRLTLGAEGLPSGGSVGYEVFDKSQGLATSNFVQNINQLRALEGELARTIASIDNVRNARVHLVLPERELFSRDKQEPSASILMRMNGSQRLEPGQVKAIQQIVAAAVPGLKPDHISIADDHGVLLSKGANGDGVNMETAEEMRANFQQSMAREIENLLERSLGFGKVRAEITADIDYSKTSENQEMFNPDQQVVRSTQTVNDASEQNDSDTNPSVTIANNLPQGTAQAVAPAINNSKSNRAEETVNYEIGRTVRNLTKEPGTIRRISTAVLVDGVYTPVAGGTPTYSARSKEEMDKIENLVKSAVGYDAQRGDQVEIVNMPFATADNDREATPRLFGLDRAELLKVSEILVLGVIGILVLFLVVRPLVQRLFESMPQTASQAAAAQALLGGPMGRQLLTGPGMGSGGAMGMGTGSDLALGDEMTTDELVDEMIDLNRIEGRVKASSLRRIGEIVEKHPEDVVAIIRNWLYQET